MHVCGEKEALVIMSHHARDDHACLGQMQAAKAREVAQLAARASAIAQANVMLTELAGLAATLCTACHPRSHALASASHTLNAQVHEG